MTRVVLLAVLGFAAGAAEQKLATSYFHASADGWRVAMFSHLGPWVAGAESYAPEYVPSGGQAGGYVRQGELERETNYWVAPAAFLGNKSAAYGGSLRFALKAEHDGGEPFDGGDVILLTRGLALVYDAARVPGRSWSNFQVELAAGKWRKNARDGAPATEAEIRRALGALNGLLIRCEYIDGADTGSLDTVELLGPAGESWGGSWSTTALQVPHWMPRYPGVEYGGSARADAGNLSFNTPDPPAQVYDYYMAALRRAGCRPIRSRSAQPGALAIHGIVPATGKPLDVAIGPNRGGARVAIQYGAN